MNYRNPHHRAGLANPIALVMLLVMLAAAASGSLASRNPAKPFPVAAAHPVMPQSRWTADEIGQLIVAIEESERYGLDPESYGLAALRSELRQSNELWDGLTTHQLDVLAHTAALNLANDYRAQAGLHPVTATDVETARTAGSLRSWLVPVHG